MEQYFALGDLKEVALTLTELGAVDPSFVHAMVRQTVEVACTKYAAKEVKQLAGLFQGLVESGGLSAGLLEGGLAKLCEGIEDFAVDAPKAKQWVPQELLAPLLASHTVTLGFMKAADAGDGGMWTDGWKLEDFFGFTTKFAVAALGAVAAEVTVRGGNGPSPAELVHAAGLDLKALAEDEAALAALLAEAKVTL